MIKNSIIDKKSSWTILLIILISSFIVRVFISGVIVGHNTDVGCFSYWAEQVYKNGITNFYNGDYFCDYPPLYMYALWVVGFLRNVFDIPFTIAAHLVILKLPAVICDIVSAYFVYRIASSRFSEKSALIISAVMAFNLAAILDSAAWGQVDSIMTLLIVLTGYFIVNDKIQLATVMYVLAVLFKPQAFIFAPILIFAMIKKKSWKQLLLSMMWGILVFVGLLLPFAIKQDPLWIFDLYFGTMGEYAYATVNAYNWPALLNANWTPDSAIFVGLSYKWWGYISILLVCAFTTLGFIKGRNRAGFTFATAGILITIVFTFASKMHERYLFPSILLVLLAFIYSKDKRFLYIHILQSITVFANCGYILYMNFTGESAIFNSYIAIVSAATVFTTLWYIKVYTQLYILNRENIPTKYLT
ncbi:MAG: hypothetical protein WCY62_05795 [Clostridia bacterium]